jgi:hypothetical protein
MAGLIPAIDVFAPLDFARWLLGVGANKGDRA